MNNNEPLMIYRYKALTRKVLTVAVVNTRTFDFSVYIDAVEGKNHDNEFMKVADYGSKLSKELAMILYSGLFIKFNWRD